MAISEMKAGSGIHTYTYIFYLLKMTWHIKIVHTQVQSKTYKAQGALTAASTTNKQTNKHKLKQNKKRFSGDFHFSSLAVNVD